MRRPSRTFGNVIEFNLDRVGVVGDNCGIWFGRGFSSKIRAVKKEMSAVSSGKNQGGDAPRIRNHSESVKTLVSRNIDGKKFESVARVWLKDSGESKVTAKTPGPDVINHAFEKWPWLIKVAAADNVNDILDVLNDLEPNFVEALTFFLTLTNPNSDRPCIFTPYYSVGELKSLLQEFIPHYGLQKDSLIDTGWPGCRFPESRWFDRFLDHLCIVKKPENIIERKYVAGSEITYELDYKWETVEQEVIQNERQRDGWEPIGFEEWDKPYSEARCLPFLREGDCNHVEAKWGRLFDIKLNVLRILYQSLASRNASQVWDASTKIINAEFSKEECHRLFEIDNLFARNLQGHYNAGLFSLLVVVWRFQQEIQTGAIGGIRNAVSQMMTTAGTFRDAVEFLQICEPLLDSIIGQWKEEKKSWAEFERNVHDKFAWVVPPLLRIRAAIDVRYVESVRNYLNVADTAGAKSTPVECAIKKMATGKEGAETEREGAETEKQVEQIEIEGLEVPEGTKWKDVRMEFVDMRTLKIGVGCDKEWPERCFNYADLGLAYRVEDGKPKSSWETLLSFAACGGRLDYVKNCDEIESLCIKATETTGMGDRMIRDRMKSRVKELNKYLRTVMKIKNNPIEFVENGYQTAFETSISEEPSEESNENTENGEAQSNRDKSDKKEIDEMFKQFSENASVIKEDGLWMSVDMRGLKDE